MRSGILTRKAEFYFELSDGYWEIRFFFRKVGPLLSIDPIMLNHMARSDDDIGWVIPDFLLQISQLTRS